VESLPHNHDVLALAFAPNGKQLAAATLNGDITLWDPHEATLLVSNLIYKPLTYLHMHRFA